MKKIRKITALVLSAAIAVNTLYMPQSAYHAKAETNQSAETSGDYIISKGEKEVTITGYNGSGGKIAIPSAIGGLPVTTIKNAAFNQKNTITGISIPESVTSIGDSAFAGCSKLVTVSIPAGIKSFGDRVFENCKALTSVKLEDGLTVVGTRAFEGCSALKKISLPDSITTIGEYAFSSCTGLRKIQIPKNVGRFFLPLLYLGIRI